LFPFSTKKLIRGILKDCWLCGAMPCDRAYVLARADLIEVLAAGNFINFTLTGVGNAIGLCGVYHTNFDRADDPGWVFHPTDIKYFIQFECDDRERRALERAAGLTPKRIVPDAETYLMRQKAQGLVPMDSTGGLYSPVLFKEFTAKVPPFMKQSYLEYLTRTRPWHGAPIAALRRAIASLGSLRIAAFSDETLNDLELLRNLYFRFPEDYNLSNIAPAPSAPSDDRRPDQRPAPGDDEHPDLEGGNPSGSGTQKKRGAETTLEGRRKSTNGKARDTGVISQKHENATFNAPIQPGEAEDWPVKMPVASMGRHAFWNLGPNSTSASCMREYGPRLLSCAREESW
jgi:hypothetical protein